MDAEKQRQMVELFTRMAEAAKADRDVAAHVRDALAQSGLLDVFGEGQALDVLELLDTGGEDALRARLKQMTLADLKQLVAVRRYDPTKATARWRSPNKFIDLIVTHAQQQLEEELAQQVPAGASWML